MPSAPVDSLAAAEAATGGHIVSPRGATVGRLDAFQQTVPGLPRRPPTGPCRRTVASQLGRSRRADAGLDRKGASLVKPMSVEPPEALARPAE
ncbi:hypothetical protein GCM10023322_52510 [Rugosimonospora acidiphila]|uniref:Uncharacterized protein n=1 Tax=Rugosimonospora acidiphila TaxID=556531 RepID=A0ABP9S9L0_9ACTN